MNQELSKPPNPRSTQSPTAREPPWWAAGVAPTYPEVHTQDVPRAGHRPATHRHGFSAGRQTGKTPGVTHAGPRCSRVAPGRGAMPAHPSRRPTSRLAPATSFLLGAAGRAGAAPGAGPDAWGPATAWGGPATTPGAVKASHLRGTRCHLQGSPDGPGGEHGHGREAKAGPGVKREAGPRPQPGGGWCWPSGEQLLGCLRLVFSRCGVRSGGPAGCPATEARG